ncbi:hypothetical protein DICA3_F39832 [Diutina catenulata]
MFRSAIPRTIARSYATTVPPITGRPGFRQLTRAPVFKTALLTFAFGTVMVEMVKSRKDLEEVKHKFINKIAILEEVVAKLERGEKVNLQSELRLANALTQTTEVEINIDDSIEQFFKEVTAEPVKETVAARGNDAPSGTKFL